MTSYAVYYVTNKRQDFRSFSYGHLLHVNLKMNVLLIIGLVFASYFGIEYVIDNGIFSHNTRSIQLEQVKLLVQEVQTFVVDEIIIKNVKDPEVPHFLSNDFINHTFDTLEVAALRQDQVIITNTSANSTTALAIFVPQNDAVNVRRYLFYILSFVLFVDLACLAYQHFCRLHEQQQPDYQEEEIIVNGRFRRISRERNQIPREEKEEQMEGVILRRDMANGRPYWVRREENQIPGEEKEEQGDGLIMLRVEIDGRRRWIRTNSFESRHREARLAEARARRQRVENGAAEERPAVRQRSMAQRAEEMADERPAIRQVARAQARARRLRRRAAEERVAEEREALH